MEMTIREGHRCGAWLALVTIDVVSLLLQEGLLLRLQIEQLRLDVLESFDLFHDVGGVLEGQQAEEDALEAEAVAPLGAVRLRQLAGEDCGAGRLSLLRDGRLLGG